MSNVQKADFSRSSDKKQVDNLSYKGLEGDGFIKLSEVLEYIPVSRSSWYRGIKEKRYPAPIKLGKRARGYHIPAIRALVEKILNEGEANV